MTDTGDHRRSGGKFLSAAALVLISLSAIGHIFGSSTAFLWGALAGLCVFFGLEFRCLTKMAKTMVVLCFALVGAEVFTNTLQADLTAQAIHRAGFLAFFLTSLGFLQYAAGRSPLMQRSGRILVHQPPGRRYVVLTFGAALFGMLMNLGTIGLLGTMIDKGTFGNAETPEAQRIAQIRRRRMTLAMLRGFCALPMFSPMTVTIALVTAAIPGLTWAQVAVWSAPLTVVFLLVGWAFDRRSYPRRQAAHDGDTPPLSGLMPILLLALAVPGAAFAVSKVLGTSMIVALLIVLPIISTVWIWIQERGSTGALLRTGREIWGGLLPSLPEMRSEITLFASAAFLGVMIAAVIDTDVLGGIIVNLGLSSGAILALAAWLIVGLSLVGISTIISVTILAATLPNLSALDLGPVMVGFMLVSAWTISVNVAPYAASVRLAARMIQADPADVGVRWNGYYGLATLCLLTLVLLSLG
ncbi:hypothetical protein [Aestuariivita boseongensis]|uniref:hypothetical protein n=1 Tax=Aestuariivita boseongensis TaxID=1470562 RepID=UPI000680B5B8|nr:hypothetical protein [Aestuariivita boseongensis]